MISQDVRAAVKLYNELIEDSNSISSYAINIRKFQEYTNKHCASNDKCKALRRCHKYGKDLQSYTTQITRFQRTRAVSFPFMKSTLVNNGFWKTKPLNNIIQVHNQLRKRYSPAASDNAMAYSDGLTYHVTRQRINKHCPTRMKYWVERGLLNPIIFRGVFLSSGHVFELNSEKQATATTTFIHTIKK